jgi:hypothetical protein
MPEAFRWRHWVAAVVLFFAVALGGVSCARAADVGRIPPNMPPEVRAWFKAVHGRNGVPCCDIANGHRTAWRGGKSGGYEVPITVVGAAGDVQFDDWVPVPPEAVTYDAGNPVGEAVVWYSIYDGKPFIRCFVPGGGV